MSLTRRSFVQSSAALAAAAGLNPASAAIVPVPFRFAYSAISWDQNIEDAIKVAGLEGKMSAIDLAELADQQIAREAVEIPQECVTGR